MDNLVMIIKTFLLETFNIGPFMSVMHKVGAFIPTLLSALIVLIVGSLVAHYIVKTLSQVLSSIDFDKISGKLGVTSVLKTGGIDKTPTNLICNLMQIVFMFIVLLMTLATFGYSLADNTLIAITGLIGPVVQGMLVLIVGMYIARFVSVLIYILAKYTGMPSPTTLSKLTKLVIMISVGILFLSQFTFTHVFVSEIHITYLIGGIIFALALSFGLGGQDMAKKYLGVFSKVE